MSFRIFSRVCPIVAGLSLSFVMLACDDSSSSGPEFVEPSSRSQSAVPASSEGRTDLQSSSSKTNTGSVSSSSVVQNESPSSSSVEKNVPSSSNVAQCYKDGMAKVTLKSVENVRIGCPNSMTFYNMDLQIFYKCEGSALIEIDMPPCENESLESCCGEASNSSVVSSSSSASAKAGVGTLQDVRDGKTYKTVVIGGKTWMAENLNFSKSSDGSIVLDSTFCYDDILTNCEKYGRLYQEDDAIKACPSGWRIPTEEEWAAMRNTVKAEFGVSDANAPLRAIGAWEDKIAATNASGFSALPAGYRAKTGQYDGEGTKAYFWGENSMLYYGWILSKQYELDKESLIRGYFAYSIRCIMSE
jgi:uncharacterized protein (TIGR02145 family)